MKREQSLPGSSVENTPPSVPAAAAKGKRENLCLEIPVVKVTVSSLKTLTGGWGKADFPGQSEMLPSLSQWYFVLNSLALPVWEFWGTGAG